MILITLASLRKAPVSKEISSRTNIVRSIEAVAALGQLSPSGEIRSLAAPTSGFGGTPRIKTILISEGDKVQKGQILAIFDNQPKITADLDLSQARLNKINKKIISQKREVARYKESVSEGATPRMIFDRENDYLTELLGERNEILAEIKGLEVDLLDTQLKSPINGIVLKINSREGERPSSEGVLKVGSSQLMEALIEVYESDINRIRLGQNVSLISENGGFSGTLLGQVKRISPQVRQRRVLTTDPTGDADARVVEVRITLNPNSVLKVERYTGMKVIARFEP
ncbi:MULTISPECIES: ABC exporter membrane fusion protein [Prochlorococcus]|uniref:DevB-like secretion protein n=1 Tax=Prochlorococcus marinus (strain SARG / CCMP1375 / SS120) TaxID=167539 RepID=Q7VCC1_PROMA|nr:MULTISPECIES: ABC exporter membrane fusion protein [Prochlorococcus]AAP99864.1 DevB-like secretion protein [Prochlorococcus marinus subsp. marinus str. CCMP1375]KGG32099.1 putative ABC transporter component [Prochlorococcus marinus str. SS51]